MEIERIKNNNKGKIPKGKKTKIKITGIKNPKEVLATSKTLLINFLKNKSLKITDPKWNDLVPKKISNFISQLEEIDFDNDDLLYNQESSISDLKNLKNWEWYSSKIINNGLEIIVKDSFYPRYIWIFHCQNIPLSKFWLEDDKFGNYGIETIRDVTTYKKFKSL